MFANFGESNIFPLSNELNIPHFVATLFII